MAARLAAAFLVTIGVTIASAQTSSPNPGNSGSTPVPLPSVRPTPDPPPLPPDVNAPDPPSKPENPTENSVTRTLKRMAPNCIDAVFHACWSGRPQKTPPPVTDDTKGAASREVGEFYFGQHNYQAARSRFDEALDYNPGDSKAMFELAQTLEKLNHPDQAAERYKDCFDLQPDGPYAERARKSMDRLLAKQNATFTPRER